MTWNFVSETINWIFFRFFVDSLSQFIKHVFSFSFRMENLIFKLNNSIFSFERISQKMVVKIKKYNLFSFDVLCLLKLLQIINNLIKINKIMTFEFF